MPSIRWGCAMLVDLPERATKTPVDPMLLALAAMDTGSAGIDAERVAQGVYVAHLNFNLGISHLIADEWPEFGSHDRNCYGVADSPEQVVEKCPWIEHDTRPFVVICTPMVKAEQSDSGGWRWHKWGPYIGDQQPTTEYLYDEPLIEKVYTFHIYEVAPNDA